MSGVLLLVGSASAADFPTGSIVIPMDTTYQDAGMLRAFGLLHALLKAGVPVHWVIKGTKNRGDADFTVASTDFGSGATLAAHGYRGGPFVVTAADANQARPVIQGFLAANPTPKVNVHVTTAAFSARSARYLTAAPTIAVIADGNEDIAFNYMNAAKVTDRNGNAWANNSPDVLTVTDIIGPSTTVHNDGKLFRPSGQPAFCQIMTMHWNVKDSKDAAVAEYRSFLGFPTHMMAECQAVNAVENNVNGHFLTPKGFVIDNGVPKAGPFTFLNAHTPFAQLDGPFELVGGSEIGYSLPMGDAFFDNAAIMIKDGATPLGTRSVWMTGYLDGRCTVNEDPYNPQNNVCGAGVGKVSYLGGHEYTTTTPISTNPKTQGARLFLNSLFEAGCTVADGQPAFEVAPVGPATTAVNSASYLLTVKNTGPGPGLALTVKATLPAGASLTSCTPTCTNTAGTIAWSLGDLGTGLMGQVSLTISFAQEGSYVLASGLDFTVGLNRRSLTGASAMTLFQIGSGSDAAAGSDGADDVGSSGDGEGLDGLPTDDADDEVGPSPLPDMASAGPDAIPGDDAGLGSAEAGGGDDGAGNGADLGVSSEGGSGSDAPVDDAAAPDALAVDAPLAASSDVAGNAADGAGPSMAADGMGAFGAETGTGAGGGGMADAAGDTAVSGGGAATGTMDGSGGVLGSDGPAADRALGAGVLGDMASGGGTPGAGASGGSSAGSGTGGAGGDASANGGAVGPEAGAATGAAATAASNGCGCRVGDPQATPATPLLPLAIVLGLALRRRDRRRP